MGTVEDIAEALEPAVRAAGLDIWDVERSGNTLRVLVDRPGGVDLDTISSLSRAVSSLLDRRDDLVPTSHYMLEVSSPGLERRLRRPEHFARSLGMRVVIKTAEPVAGERRVEGTLVRSDSETVTLLRDSLASTGSAEPIELTIPLHLVDRARTLFSWADSRTSSVRTTATSGEPVSPARTPGSTTGAARRPAGRPEQGAA
jgi:ribosome maturation factor RimP